MTKQKSAKSFLCWLVLKGLKCFLRAEIFLQVDDGRRRLCHSFLVVVVVSCPLSVSHGGSNCHTRERVLPPPLLPLPSQVFDIFKFFSALKEDFLSFHLKKRPKNPHFSIPSQQQHCPPSLLSPLELFFAQLPTTFFCIKCY